MTEAQRRDVLDTANEAVNKDRNNDYGDPEDNFKDIAALWNAYAYMFDTDEGWNRTDVAVMMILVKIARCKTSPTVMDHWADIAGYAACGYESALADAAPDEEVGDVTIAWSDGDPVTWVPAL